jgi:hypothetical protein
VLRKDFEEHELAGGYVERVSPVDVETKVSRSQR